MVLKKVGWLKAGDAVRFDRFSCTMSGDFEVDQVAKLDKLRCHTQMQKTFHDSALVLFSGGQDSTTILYWAKQKFSRVEALAFDYGQKHSVELEQAKLIAEKAEVPLVCFDIQGTLQGSALTEHDKDMSATHPLNADLPSSFVTET